MYMLVPNEPHIQFHRRGGDLHLPRLLLGFASHSPGGLGVFDAAMMVCTVGIRCRGAAGRPPDLSFSLLHRAIRRGACRVGHSRIQTSLSEVTPCHLPTTANRVRAGVDRLGRLLGTRAEDREPPPAPPAPGQVRTHPARGRFARRGDLGDAGTRWWCSIRMAASSPSMRRLCGACAGAAARGARLHRAPHAGACRGDPHCEPDRACSAHRVLVAAAVFARVRGVHLPCRAAGAVHPAAQAFWSSPSTI